MSSNYNLKSLQLIKLLLLIVMFPVFLMSGIDSASTYQSKDVEKPVIELNGPKRMTLYVGDTYTELGAYAVDKVDGRVPVKITGEVDTSHAGKYIVTYTAVDRAGNKAEAHRYVKVKKDLAPVIRIIGKKHVYVRIGDTYTDAGAVAIDKRDGRFPATAHGVEKVDTSTIGKYFIRYTAVDSTGHEAKPKRRVVEVVEDKAPIIKLKGNAFMKVFLGDKFRDPGVEVTDDFDENLTLQVRGKVNTNEVGRYRLIYTAIDSRGNVSKPKVRVVKVIRDTVPPKIILKKNRKPLIVQEGKKYKEPGYIVKDNHDKNVSVEIENNVDTSVPGTYKVIYRATDEAGNSAEKIRIVIVNARPVAVIEANATAIFGEPFVLDASKSYDPDGNVTKYLWSTGDTDSRIVLDDLPLGKSTFWLKVVDDRRGRSTKTTFTVETLLCAGQRTIGVSEEISDHLNLNTVDRYNACYKIELSSSNGIGEYALYANMLAGTTGRNGNYLAAYLYDETHTPVGATIKIGDYWNGDTYERATLKIPSDGTYYLRFYRYGKLKTNYAFSIEPSLENGLEQNATTHELNDEFYMAAPITIEEAQAGINETLNYGRESIPSKRHTDTDDYYSIELKAGEYALYANMLAGTEKSTYQYLEVQLYDGSYTAIGSTIKIGLKSGDSKQVTLTIPRDGIYYLKFRRMANLKANYKFSLESKN